MKTSLRYLMVLFFGMLLIFSFAACGSSGGGGGGNDGLTYEGNRYQATVTDENADDLAIDSFEGGETGGDIGGGIGAVQKSGGGMVGTKSALALARVLENSILKVDLTSGNPAVGATEGGSESGSCGGRAEYTITVDQSGNFSGKMVFKSYCEDGTITNGTVKFSGLIDTSTDELLRFTFKFDMITVSEDSESFSADGYISFDVTSMPKTVSMDLLMRDNVTGHMVWINNYLLSVTEGSDVYGNYELISFSGRFYDSVEGFIDISTPVPIKTYKFDEHPESGELRIDGAGSTYALLLFVDKDHFQVLAETDGNAATFPDWDSGVIAWSSL
jgi:hypothetical protein